MNYSKTAFTVATTLVFLLSFVLLFLSMDRHLEIYDEGVILTAAMRISAGDIPHRDFYIPYGPAEPYIISWLFDIFGQHILVERICDLVVRAGILTALYASLVFQCRQTIALVATIVCAFWLASVGNHGYPIYPTLLLTTISSTIMVRILSQECSIRYALIAGLLTGLAALVRYDVGFFAFVAHILSAFLIIYLSKPKQVNLVNSVISKLSAYIFSTGLPVILLLVWYWSNGTLSSFIHDIIDFPRHNYASTRNLPFPTLFSWKSAAIYLPLLIICTAVFCLKNASSSQYYDKTSKHYDSHYRYQVNYLIVFTLLTIMFYLKGLVRVSEAHMQLALIPALMTLAVLVEMALKNSLWHKVVTLTIALLACVTAINSEFKNLRYKDTVVLSDLSGFYHKLILNPDVSAISITNKDGTSANQHTDLPFLIASERYAATRYIMDNTTKDERIFVGLTRHDKVFINDVSSYFLTQRLPVTKWHHVDPGLQTSADIQTDIAKDLEQKKPRFIWLESTWDNKNEPNDSAKSSGVFILDDYIKQHYQLAKSFGQIAIWQRK